MSPPVLLSVVRSKGEDRSERPRRCLGLNGGNDGGGDGVDGGDGGDGSGSGSGDKGSGSGSGKGSGKGSGDDCGDDCGGVGGGGSRVVDTICSPWWLWFSTVALFDTSSVNLLKFSSTLLLVFP